MMSVSQIFAKLVSKGFYVEPDAIQKLSDIATEDIPSFISWLNKENVQKVSAETIGRFKTYRTIEYGICVTDYSDKIKITATPQDWVKYFNSRYNKIKSILAKKIGPADRIADLKVAQGKVNIIGQVYEQITTKKGHQMWVIEDPHGRCRAIIMKSKKELTNKARWVLSDSVIALSGAVSPDGGAIFVDDIELPDIPYVKWPNGSNGKIVFLSDTHIGSKYALTTFLDNAIDEINQIKDLRAVVHLGDLCDSRGVFPTQEKELIIKSFADQYKTAAAHLSKLRQDIPVFLLPGNHSLGGASNKIPAPSVPLTEDTAPLHSLPNIRPLSDPAELIINNKIRILLTHGVSLHAIFVAYGLSPMTESIIIAMRAFLQHRHLSPIYGVRQSQVVPTHEDYLVIDNVPHLIASAHIHIAAQGEYKGVKLLNTGSMQAETPYMRSQGIIVTPPSYAILDISNGNIETRSF